MKYKRQQMLIELLQEFFEEVDLTKSGVLNKNNIAALIKSRLIKLGYWKNRKRGNPSIENFKS
jgi:hypothetical protein